MTARHRISKMLLSRGRVYPKPTTWKQDQRRWLASQHFNESTSELAYLNLFAQVDALTSRKLARSGGAPGRTQRPSAALTFSEVLTGPSCRTSESRSTQPMPCGREVHRWHDWESQGGGDG